MRELIDNAQELIYDSDTVAMIVDVWNNDQATLNNNSNIVTSKRLTGGYQIVYAQKALAEKLIANADLSSNSVYPNLLTLQSVSAMESSGITQVWNHPGLDLQGNGVLVGIIDTGIDYTKPCFMHADGVSKIKYIWDQSIKGNSPKGFLYGTEYTHDDIKAALINKDPFSVLPHRDTVGHGTFLASVAAGSNVDTVIGAAPNADIVVVKLKRSRVTDLERNFINPNIDNVYSTDDFMLGVQYLVDKAAELSQPIAICIAVGNNNGGHEGSSIIEKFLDRVAAIVGTSVCVAAGNEAQAGHHAMGKLEKTGDTKDLEFKASDKNENVYIRLWSAPADRISVSVKSPTGEQVARVQAQSGVLYSRKLVLEKSTVMIEYIFPIESAGGQETTIRILSATQGVWTISVHGDNVLSGVYHAWLPVIGILDPENRFLQPTSNYTVVSPGAALGAITCGAYDNKDNSLYINSGQGPSRMAMNLPDLVAPGVNVNGMYPYGMGTMTGTSVSTAVLTGACALLLQWGIVQKHDPELDSYRLRAYFISGCDRDTNLTYPNTQWGYGRLNLFNTFKNLRPS